MAVRKLSKKKLKKLLEELARDRVVYGPVSSDGQVSFAEASGGELALEKAISDRPPKNVFFPQAEVLLTYSGGETKDETYTGRPAAVFGARPCDARAFAVIDRVFLGEPPEDPCWRARRRDSLVLALACNRPASTCFCHWMGGGPFGEEGVDVLLTDLGSEFLLKACTPAGERALGASKVLQEAGEDDLAASEQLKGQAEARLSGSLDVAEAKRALEALWDEGLWEDFSSRCLGCAACAYLCPTCHCFDVQDEGSASRGRRLRIWDACMFGLFTKEASGHNPRTATRERLRQRVMHKFSYFPDKFKAVACVGCGRCVRACPSNVDLREVLRRAVQEAVKR